MECPRPKNCLKEINPKHFPGVYWGEPWVFNENIGCCCDCVGGQQRLAEEEETSEKEISV
jgi:hypothetical protein